MTQLFPPMFTGVLLWPKWRFFFSFARIGGSRTRSGGSDRLVGQFTLAGGSRPPRTLKFIDIHQRSQEL